MTDFKTITDPEERLLLSQCVYALHDGLMSSLQEIAQEVDLTYESIRGYVVFVYNSHP